MWVSTNIFNHGLTYPIQKQIQFPLPYSHLISCDIISFILNNHKANWSDDEAHRCNQVCKLGLVSTYLLEGLVGRKVEGPRKNVLGLVYSKP